MKKTIGEAVDYLVKTKDKLNLPAFTLALNVKFLKVAEAAKAEETERLINGGWIMAPAAYRGGNDKKLLQVYAPMWEKNMEMLIEVCLCDKCPDSVPRLNEMAKDFNLALFCKDDDGKYVSVKALLNNHDQK